MPSKNIKNRYRGKKNDRNISIFSRWINWMLARMGDYFNSRNRQNRERDQRDEIKKKNKRGNREKLNF